MAHERPATDNEAMRPATALHASTGQAAGRVRVCPSVRAAAAGSAPHLWLGARRARPLGPLVLDRHARAPRNGVLNSAHGRRHKPAGRPQQVPGRAMRGRCTCVCVWMACRMYTPNGSLAPTGPPTDTSFDLSMPAAWHAGLLYTARRIIRLPYIRVLYPYIMDPLPYGYYIRLYTAVCLFGLLW